MEIRIQQTGQVVSEREFMAMHRHTSFTLPLTLSQLEGKGVDVVLEAPAPAVGANQVAERKTGIEAAELVEKNGRTWYQQAWTVRDIPQQDIDRRKEAQRAAIQQQIDDLERSAMLNRGSRELELRLMEKEADAIAASMGATREQVLATIPYYAKIQALDDQVTALRIQKGAIA